MRSKYRQWIPSRKYVLSTTIPVSVEYWQWTNRKGLRVRYKSGLECKSDYGSLREFLLALKEGREHATEVTNYRERVKRMRLEAKLEQLLPDWPTFRVQFHELWGDGEGGWSVNDSWTPFKAATRAETIGHLRARWQVFKANYLPKARVKDLVDISSEDEHCMIEIDCVAFATLTKGE